MKETLALVLSEVLNTPVTAETLRGDADLITEWGLNSLDMMQFILKAENAFKITIDIERFDLNNFKDLSQLQAFLHTCLAEVNP